MVGFGDIVGRFTGLAEDECCGSEPSVVIYVELEDCPKDNIEMVLECVNTFLEDHIGNSIWTRGLVGFQLSDSLANPAAREVVKAWEWLGVDGCWWDRGGCWGRGKEGFCKGCRFFTVGGV